MMNHTISHYKILAKSGEGGMGVVYKAEDTRLKRTVALKFLPPELTRDPGAKECFVHEAQAAAGLNHPNICTIHEIDEREGQSFIAMEYIEGQDLKVKIESKQMKLDEALAIVIQVAEGLKEAHEKGIIHRDIKSANIMVTSKGQAKIMDFGLAQLTGRMQAAKAGVTTGTLAYMSPEQAQGEGVDHRTDIWSLGIVLYEMVTGHLPFKGDYVQAVIYSILNEDPKPIKSLRSDVPLELEGIVNKALVKNPDERYPHINDLIVELRSLKKQLESGITEALKTKVLPSPFIAVLPFVNMSGEKENEYFSDGITEDIIAQLSKIGDLKVISRTSIMKYKHSDKGLREIGEELGVTAILEGSVRKADNRVRIVGQLINAQTDEHIWAEIYDRELKDIFDIQSDVAQQIALALKAKISPKEKERLAKKQTEDLTAYDYYLKGRDYYYRYHKQDNEIAIELFKKAIQLDPNYALAYAGLGDAYAQRTLKFGFEPTWLDSAIQSSKKATSIDPDLAEGYKALGLAYITRGWFRKALEVNHKALELNASYYPALTNIGWGYYHIGEYQEALRYMKKSLVLNPTGAYDYFGVGCVYLKLEYFTQAEKWLNQTLELQPDFAYAHVGLIELYLGRGEYEKASEHSQIILTISPDDVRGLQTAGDVELLLGNYERAKEYYQKAIAICSTGHNTYSAVGLGYIFWKTGQKNKAQEMFTHSLELNQKKLEQGQEWCGVPYEISAVHAIQGNKPEALRWLQKAIYAGWREYRKGLIDPLLENLRNEDQFERMMAEVKSMVDQMRKRVEEFELLPS